MVIKEQRDGNKLIINIDGRIDTNTAPDLNDYLVKNLNGIKALEINLEKVDYISSAGLRALLFAQKIMDGQGSMVVSHVCKDIMETFELTCFTDVLTII